MRGGAPSTEFSARSFDELSGWSFDLIRFSPRGAGGGGARAEELRGKQQPNLRLLSTAAMSTSVPAQNAHVSGVWKDVDRARIPASPHDLDRPGDLRRLILCGGRQRFQGLPLAGFPRCVGVPVPSIWAVTLVTCEGVD